MPCMAFYRKGSGMLRCLAFALLLASVGAIAQAQEGRNEDSPVNAALGAMESRLNAGIGRVDLTPPLTMRASLGGYGARMNQPAMGVHDRIFAKALVLSDGSKRFVLVTADVLGFPTGFKAALLDMIGDQGWQHEQVMLLPSHSHTSIDMTAINPRNTLGIPQIGVFHPELFNWTLERLAEVITQASQQLTTVSVGTRTIQLEGWNRNRRKDSDICDRNLVVTRIDTDTGLPFAVLVNWTAHPTFMGPEDMLFSGGWPGHLQRTVEALIGHGVTVLYHNGAQGDQSPIARRDSGGNWERAECYGRELGIAVWRVWERIEPVSVAPLAYHSEKIPLPSPHWHPDFMKTGGAEYALSEELMADLVAGMLPSQTQSHSLRLGDLLIIGIPGEMTAQLGLSVKSQVRNATGIPHIAIGGLADEWVSYILSPKEYRKGGYETSVSFYGKDLGPRVVEAAVKGASELWE